MQLTCNGCGRTYEFTSEEKYQAAKVRLEEVLYCKACICDACRGRGWQYGRGVFENGEWKGSVWDCVRCVKKGWQTNCGEGKHVPERRGVKRCCDVSRNEVYDNHYRRINSN